MSCYKARASNWSSSESACLLQVFKERQVINKMDSKEYRHSTIMKLLSDDLRAHGFTRSAEQIKTRLKTMKDQYNKIKNSLKKSGAGREVDWIHYADMDEIYGSRPSANRRGVDSARNVLLKQSGSEKSSSTPPKCASTKPTQKNVFRKAGVDDSQVDLDSALNDENIPPADANLLPAFQEELQHFDDSVQSQTEFFEIEDPLLFVENSSLPPPEPSKLGSFIMNQEMGVDKDSLEVSTEEGKSVESNNSEGSFTDSALGIGENFEKDNEEESLNQKRKKRRQEMEDEKKKIIESMITKRAEDTKSLMTHQEKMQNKATEDLQRILQQNCLLLIQVFAMSQNHSQIAVQSAGTSFMPPPVFHSAPSAYCYPGQVAGYPGQISGYPGQIPGYLGQAAGGFSASPFLPNQPYDNNYFGAQIPSSFGPPLIPNVSNTHLFQGSVIGSSSPAPNLITQPQDIEYGSQIVGKSATVAVNSCSEEVAEPFNVLSKEINDVLRGNSETNAVEDDGIERRDAEDVEETDTRNRKHNA